jgi:hypothetical protein
MRRISTTLSASIRFEGIDLGIYYFIWTSIRKASTDRLEKHALDL